MNVENLELLSKIDGLRNEIGRHIQALNTEAMWFFMATLGCWSINISWVQLLGISFVFMILFIKVFANKKDNASWSEKIREIMKKINLSNLEEDSKKARMYDLDKLKKDMLGFKTMYKSAPIFLLCYVFWTVSFVNFTIKFA